jgi:TM2 domain-containing membrane protein YozV
MAEEKAGEEKKEVSKKNRLIALLLCFFAGWGGGHRFYVNKIGTGLLMLFTMGGFGMWYFLDLVMIASGVFKDKENLPVTNWK